MIPLIQTWLFAVLALALFAIEVWAFINALRFRPDAYVAAGKRTKTFWGILTGVAMLLGFLSLPYPIGGGGGMFLFMLGGIIIAGIFLADVLPALKRVVGRSRGNNRRWCRRVRAPCPRASSLSPLARAPSPRAPRPYALFRSCAVQTQQWLCSARNRSTTRW